MYNDGYSWQFDNRLQQKAYDLLNGELSWLSVDEAWRLRLYGINLLDEEYMAQGIAEVFGDHFAAAAPRTIGIALKYSFF